MNKIRPDSAAILSQLKDFQRDTVDYIFKRMYIDGDCTRRFLVADEVGIGKTLVARGLIAKVIDHLWDRGGRIDIVYICSNADIARQNINRLNVTGEQDFALASRITLLPLTLGEAQRGRLRHRSQRRFRLPHGGSTPQGRLFPRTIAPPRSIAKSAIVA